MNKKSPGVSVEDIEHFARKHTTEVFSVVALVASSISALFSFFSGTGWSIFFFTLSVITAIFFPSPIDKGLKVFYRYTFQQEKTTEVLFGIGKVVLAVFLPFLYFSLLGFLAGTAFHYYIRHSHKGHDTGNFPPHVPSHGDEHD